MKLLLVAAVPFEIRPLLKHLTLISKTNERLQQYRFKDSLVDLLITGIGMTFTSFEMGKQLAVDTYDLAIDAGICGSFNPSIGLGSVVNVTEDCFSELGGEDKDRFLTLFQLGLLDPDKYPFREGKLINDSIIRSGTITGLKKVKGITVNTITGSKLSIEKVRSLFNPDIESMEGAAFLFACLSEKIPCAQIRSVSNFVDMRDKSQWNMELALRNLNDVLLEIFKEICE